MDELDIRKEGHAGRITLTRSKALNALNYAMISGLTQALTGWRDDPDVRTIIIDAEGDRAFCAGGDIAAVYHAAKAGDHQLGRRFFADEYVMNAMIRDYPKPIVAFMQGFVMGGGVGVGGHASCRIVGDTTQVAMPETGIGLIPDVGGTWLLARAPGYLGEYLGLTGRRMSAGDAIHAGFADLYLPETEWPAAIQLLVSGEQPSAIQGRVPAPSQLTDLDLSAFGEADLDGVMTALREAGDTETLATLARNSALSMAATLRMVRAARQDTRMQESLSREFRFTARASAESDFLEGVRAQLIDKDRKPAWSDDASPARVDALLASLGADELTWDRA